MITLVTLLICLITVIIRRMEGSWYSPASLFSLLWAAVIVFSVVSAPDYYFSYQALAFVLFNIALFFMGGKFLEYYFGSKASDSTQRKYPQPFDSRLFLAAGLISGIIAVALLIRDSGNSLNILFDVKKIVNLSDELTEDRYYGGRLSAITMLCLTVSYLASFFAGMDLAIKPGRSSKVWLVLLLTPILIFTLIYTARAVLLFMIFIILASFITFRPYRKAESPTLFNKFNIVAVLTGLFMIFLVFFFAQAARMQVNKFEVHQVEMLLDHLRVWFSGNISAFSIWYDTGEIYDFGNPGSNTFAGIYEFLGFSKRKLGIYDMAADVNYHMEFSNIYTLFRFLTDDFGRIGTSIIFFVFGGLSRLFYIHGLKTGNLVSGAILCGIVVMILWSFITSAFAYNSVLFAWLGFVIIMRFYRNYAN